MAASLPAWGTAWVAFVNWILSCRGGQCTMFVIFVVHFFFYFLTCILRKRNPKHTWWKRCSVVLGLRWRIHADGLASTTLASTSQFQVNIDTTAELHGDMASWTDKARFKINLLPVVCYTDNWQNQKYCSLFSC